jgi:uncharacterized membrane protein
MSGDSALDYERFDQEARKILLEHYTSKNIHHGASLLSAVIAFFAAIQASDKIVALVSYHWLKVLLSLLVTITFFLAISMLYLGALGGAVLRVFPTPPRELEQRNEYLQNYLTLLETGIVIEVRSRHYGAFIYLLRKTSWRWPVLGSVFLFSLSFFDQSPWRPAPHVLSAFLLKHAFLLLGLTVMVIILILVWFESRNVSGRYRGQKKKDKFFLETRSQATYGYRMRRWADCIQALTGLCPDSFLSEALDKFRQKDSR